MSPDPKKSIARATLEAEKKQALTSSSKTADVATPENKKKSDDSKKANSKPVGSAFDSANNSTREAQSKLTKTLNSVSNSTASNATTDKTEAKNSTAGNSTSMAKAASVNTTSSNSTDKSQTKPELKEDTEPTGKASEKVGKSDVKESGLIDVTPANSMNAQIKTTVFLNGKRTELKPIDVTNVQTGSSMSISDRIRSFFGFK